MCPLKVVNASLRTLMRVARRMVLHMLGATYGLTYRRCPIRVRSVGRIPPCDGGVATHIAPVLAMTRLQVVKNSSVVSISHSRILGKNGEIV